MLSMNFPHAHHCDDREAHDDRDQLGEVICRFGREVRNLAAPPRLRARPSCARRFVDCLRGGVLFAGCRASVVLVLLWSVRPPNRNRRPYCEPRPVQPSPTVPPSGLPSPSRSPHALRCARIVACVRSGRRGRPRAQRVRQHAGTLHAAATPATAARGLRPAPPAPHRHRGQQSTDGRRHHQRGAYSDGGAPDHGPTVTVTVPTPPPPPRSAPAPLHHSSNGKDTAHLTQRALCWVCGGCCLPVPSCPSASASLPVPLSRCGCGPLSFTLSVSSSDGAYPGASQSSSAFTNPKTFIVEPGTYAMPTDQSRTFWKGQRRHRGQGLGGREGGTQGGRRDSGGGTHWRKEAV